MTNAPRRRAACGVPCSLLRAAVASMLIGSIAAGCTSDTRTSDGRRRDERVSDARRGRALPDVDTTSLVTPLRGDSLVGAARGAGGQATLRSECLACHPAVHDAPLGRGRGPLAACLVCHETDHEPIQAFYAGAVQGMPVPPDTMFLVRVSCAECHTDSTFAAPPGAARLAALDGMCTSCHGERFAGMLARWARGVQWRSRAAAAYVSRAAADPRLEDESARRRIRIARDAIDLVRTAGPLHNVRGADQLFRAAIDSTVAAYRESDVPAPARPSLGPDPARIACLGCHYGVEAARTTVFGETFDHASHVVRSEIGCTECHSDASYFAVGAGEGGKSREIDPRHGRTSITARACAECHHTSAAGATACTSCHQPAELRGARPVATAMRVTPSVTRQRQLPFRHEQHGALRCESCHAPSVSRQATAACTSCHGEHHRPDISCVSCHADAKAVHTRQAHLGCAGCHDATKVASLQPTRAVCQSCHADMTDHNPGRDCAQCHQVAWRPATQSVRRR